MSRITNQPLRPLYYSRSAHMYRAVNELLSDKSVSFHRKLYSLIQLSMVEHTVQRSKLQSIHAQAIDDFIESHGGPDTLLTASANEAPIQLLNCQLLAGQFVRSQPAEPRLSHYQITKKNFLTNLARMHAVACVQRIQPQATTHNHVKELMPISAYLLSLVKDLHQSGDGIVTFRDHAGACFCCLSIALTIIECDLVTSSTIKYLQLAQQYMMESSKTIPHSSDNLIVLHPAAATYILSKARVESFPGNARKRELRISEALIDASKLFVLLTNEKRVDITTMLLQCILLATNLDSGRHGGDQTPLNPEYLRLLEQDIDKVWSLRQGNR